eukprot:Sspe_Gene.27931::Locus_12368_Transcript_1_1_Confidence_1.000_Length_563::g.27931::m.27931
MKLVEAEPFVTLPLPSTPSPKKREKNERRKPPQRTLLPTFVHAAARILRDMLTQLVTKRTQSARKIQEKKKERKKACMLMGVCLVACPISRAGMRGRCRPYLPSPSSPPPSLCRIAILGVTKRELAFPEHLLLSPPPPP